MEQDKEALGELLGFLDEWEKEGMEPEDLELDEGAESNIVSIPKSISIGIPHISEVDDTELPEFEDLEASTEVGLPQASKAAKPAASKSLAGFKVFDDEVPPIPLDDYTPMDVDDTGPQEAGSSAISAEPGASPYVYETFDNTEAEELPPLEDLPAFDELGVPDFRRN